jgi:transposase
MTSDARAERDAAVLALLARGRRHAVIAQAVGCSERTVRRIARRARADETNAPAAESTTEARAA